MPNGKEMPTVPLHCPVRPDSGCMVRNVSRSATERMRGSEQASRTRRTSFSLRPGTSSRGNILSLRRMQYNLRSDVRDFGFTIAIYFSGASRPWAGAGVGGSGRPGPVSMATWHFWLKHEEIPDRAVGDVARRDRTRPPNATRDDHCGFLHVPSQRPFIPRARGKVVVSSCGVGRHLTHQNTAQASTLSTA